VDNTPETSGLDTSMLIAMSIGLGSVAVVLAGVAMYLLLNSHGLFTKARYRSNHSTTEVEVEPVEL
jgi:hypothetical protein